MNKLRTMRLSHSVCREFNNILRCSYRDILRDVTITAVEIAPDMHDARVYVSVLGDEKNEHGMLDLLKKHLGPIKKQVFERIQLKYTPRISLYLDRSIGRGQHVLELLDSLVIDER